MFSKTVEYALRAVVHLTQQGPEPQRTSDIAASTKVPPAYLSKVLQSLREKGIVDMQRGSGGGVTLAQAPKALSILQVINAVEPIERIKTCPLDLPGHGTNLCALHRRMDNVIKETELAFQSTTLAELLADPNPSIPLCDAMGDAKKKR